MSEVTAVAAVAAEKVQNDQISNSSGSSDAGNGETPATATSVDGDQKETTEEVTKDEKKDEKEEEKEKVVVGMVLETKSLYAKIDENGDRSWSDKEPSDLEEAAENEETQKFAILVRKRKPRQASSAKPLEIDSLIIQSPLLKNALHDILEDYPGIITNVTRLKFSAPFECFVHRWDALEEALHDESRDEMTREHLKLLHKILADDLGAIIQLRKDYFKNKAIAFEHVWVLFPPGCTILTQYQGQTIAAKFSSGYYAQTQCGKVYSLSVDYFEWDGVRLGWRTTSSTIRAYPGTKPFASLGTYRIEHDLDIEGTTEKLMQRGRRWESLIGFNYKAYDGIALYHPDSETTVRERAECRIVLDCAKWEDENSGHVIYQHSVTYTESRNDVLNGTAQRPKLTDEQLLMASPMVRGYALKNKRWLEFFVENVTEIEFNKDTFSSLVLSKERKELILAFAQSQVKFKHSFDDVVSGKGKGIIMLLSGGPGIGKTLTAESVAEEMRVPLYTMSAGDLGADADSVDSNLSKLMSMVSNWNAVLLLDECDVFLEERTANDLERNRIVSIFLRTLEYYEGILFLTTNRVENIDQAFQSRIHVTLEYPDLDAASRATIWKLFLSRTGANGKGQDLSEEDLAVLSAIKINGRQIKNIMKMANLLALQKQEVFTLVHVQTVLRVQGHMV